MKKETKILRCIKIGSFICSWFYGHCKISQLIIKCVYCFVNEFRFRTDGDWKICLLLITCNMKGCVRSRSVVSTTDSSGVVWVELTKAQCFPSLPTDLDTAASIVCPCGRLHSSLQTKGRGSEVRRAVGRAPRLIPVETARRTSPVNEKHDSLSCSSFFLRGLFLCVFVVILQWHFPAAARSVFSYFFKSYSRSVEWNVSVSLHWNHARTLLVFIHTETAGRMCGNAKPLQGIQNVIIGILGLKNS